MSFLETIERARAFLERQQRVSLRALRREFGLDTETLDELIEELVDVQRVARREENVLVSPVAGRWRATTCRPPPVCWAGRSIASTATIHRARIWRSIGVRRYWPRETWGQRRRRSTSWGGSSAKLEGLPLPR